MRGAETAHKGGVFSMHAYDRYHTLLSKDFYYRVFSRMVSIFITYFVCFLTHLAWQSRALLLAFFRYHPGLQCYEFIATENVEVFLAVACYFICFSYGCSGRMCRIIYMNKYNLGTYSYYDIGS